MRRPRLLSSSAMALMGLLSLLSLATGLYGQEKATIVGTVTDSTGAVMPGVKVTITNTKTGAVRELVRNTAGSYSAPELPIGSYSVRAEYPRRHRTTTGAPRAAVEQQLAQLTPRRVFVHTPLMAGQSTGY